MCEDFAPWRRTLHRASSHVAAPVLVAAAAARVAVAPGASACVGAAIAVLDMLLTLLNILYYDWRFLLLYNMMLT